MIHEQIVTYEVAKLAKDKGFNVATDRYYHIYDDVKEAQNSLEMTGAGCADFYNSLNQCRCAAPTQSLLQRWLREEKGVVVEVIAQPTCSTSKKNCYWWSIKQNSDGFCYQYEECSYLLYSDEGYFDTYELALEDALKYALKKLV